MSLADELSALLPPGSRLEFGELRLQRRPDGVFEARHRSDDGNPDPRVLDSTRQLRELAKFDEAGSFRPLKTAPNLKAGWTTETADPREFLRRLDAVYPGVFAAWIAWSRGELPPVPLRRTLERQTGIYRIAGTITGADADRILTEVCAAGCLRQVVWPVAAELPAPAAEVRPGTLPMICAEACTIVMNRARELARAARTSGPAGGRESPGP